jgi:hypothetical protein
MVVSRTDFLRSRRCRSDVDCGIGRIQAVTTRHLHAGREWQVRKNASHLSLAWAAKPEKRYANLSKLSRNSLGDY